MQLSATPFKLYFTHPFVLSKNTRTHTEVVFVRLQSQGLTGYGEAAFPPYLPGRPEITLKELSTLNLRKFSVNTTRQEVRENLLRKDLDKATMTALDIALFDLYAKKENLPLYNYLHLDKPEKLISTYTIAISTPEQVKEKVKENSQFNYYKLKLGGEADEAMIEAYREITDEPFAVDVNEGWKNVNVALRKIKWLAENGCEFVEQPLPVALTKDMQQLKKTSPLPLIADESLQTVEDLEQVAQGFHGINIKLLKSVGISGALDILKKAKALNLRVMLGCMSESSCAVAAAAHLAAPAFVADLDGPFLIKNDPFEGLELENGLLRISPAPGIGVSPKKDLIFQS